MTKTFTIGILFTQKELAAAARLYKTAGPGEFATRCAEEIVKPILPRINETTGQENDPKYLAYLLEHVITAL